MIHSVEKINIPTSGKYREVIYDIPSTWNSQKWTWMKFTNDDFTEWCGEFRGEYRGHGISVKHGIVYVLTSDYLYQLDINNSAILSYEDQPEYKQLSVSPKGDCVVADYYHISILDNRASEKISVETPISLDMICFVGWQDKDLIIHADEFLNWENHVVIKLDSESWNAEIINQTKPSYGSVLN